MAVSTAQDFTVKYTYFEIAVDGAFARGRRRWPRARVNAAALVHIWTAVPIYSSRLEGVNNPEL